MSETTGSGRFAHRGEFRGAILQTFAPAAPLDRPGSIKGGPYSDGAFDGSGQFGLLDIADEGDTISVTTTGVNWNGDVLVERTFTFDAS